MIFLSLFSSRVWGGTAAELSLLISDIPTASRDSLKLRKVVRTQTSVVCVLPSPNDEVLVESHNRSYTVNDYDDFFRSYWLPARKKKAMEKGQTVITYPLAEHSPQVTAHCLYGTRVPTIEKYHFKNGEFPDKQPTVTYGDGDGIVNKRSLEACNKWSQR